MTGTYLLLMSLLFFRKERHALNGTLACLELLLESGAELESPVENGAEFADFKGDENP